MVGKKNKEDIKEQLKRLFNEKGYSSTDPHNVEHIIIETRKSEKRSIRFEFTEQMDLIQLAVDQLNYTGEVGQRASFNSFVVDSAVKEAKRILRKKGFNMEFIEASEIIRSRPNCQIRWMGIPGRGEGKKELSQDEGPAELQKILHWAKAGGQILFFYPDLENPSIIHERELSPLL